MLKKKIKKLLSRGAENKTSDIPVKNETTPVHVENKIPVTSGHDLFFIHIPKTAGTSFRVALEEHNEVIKDYGVKSAETSEILKESIYIKHDPYHLKYSLKNSPSQWLCGHVPLQKYIDFVPVVNTVAFVRAPLKQVISHYNHFVSYYDFKGDLASFINKPGILNIQHQLLAFLPLGLIGCVGITESFNDSLMLINDHLQTDVTARKANVNETKKLSATEIDATLKEMILKKNHLDVKLYDEACFIHRQRLEQKQAGKPWVYAYANINVNNVLHGCAYFADNENAVELSIHKNGQEIKQIKAEGFYGAHAKANFPRERYIAYHFPLAKDVTATDVFDVYVKETGQKINYRPLKKLI
jgi:hypothetical protein